MSDNVASRNSLTCRVVYSLIGILIGLSVFLSWLFFVKPKTDASIHISLSGCLSGVLAAWNLVTHLMHLKDYWRTWLRGLKLFMFIGAFFMIVTAAGFIAYLVLGITKSEKLTVASFYIASVWCFVSFKWAAMLLWHSRSYRNEFADLTVLLDF